VTDELKTAKRIIRDTMKKDLEFRNNTITTMAESIYRRSNIDMMKCNDIANEVLNELFQYEEKK
jgi:hypothetical protein